MRALVVYESIYGNTHTIADAIADGLRAAPEVDAVDVLDIGRADAVAVAAADLLVVGGPTHAHSMSRPSTRSDAIGSADRPGHELELDPSADAGSGVREWLDRLDRLGDRETAAVAFDTRIDFAAALTGRASKAIDRALRHHGFTTVAKATSFLVTKENVLVDGEVERARAWGASVASQAAPARR